MGKRRVCKKCGGTSSDVSFIGGMSKLCKDCVANKDKKRKVRTMTKEEIIQWNIDNPIDLDHRTRYGDSI